MKKFVINLRDRISETDVVIRSLPIYQYVSAHNKLFLISNIPPTLAIKFCKPVRNIFLLDSSASAMRRIFDKCKFILQLSSLNDNIHSLKCVYDIENKLCLDNNTLSSTRLLLEKGSTSLFLNATSGLVSKTSYSSFCHKICLNSEMVGNNYAHKFVDLIHNLPIVHSVNPTSFKRTEATINTMNLGSTVSKVYMTKYRTLGEMDYDNETALTLSSFDNMSLEDIDYIII